MADGVRLSYGSDPSQFGLIWSPAGPSRASVVVIHGGFWKAQYGLEYAIPIAEDLALRGFTVWAPEYRRVGNGGGYPETLDDIDAAFTALAESGADVSQLVVLGHSAGGHLATWAATRGDHQRWAGPAGGIALVISQAGVVSLESAVAANLGDGAIQAFVGEPGPDYDLADPSRQGPIDADVWCVHARDDDDVPFSQSVEYVARLRAMGTAAVLLEVSGGHMGVVQPDSSAWLAIVEIIEGHLSRLAVVADKPR